MIEKIRQDIYGRLDKKRVLRRGSSILDRDAKCKIHDLDYLGPRKW
jgi:hypothetical protein